MRSDSRYVVLATAASLVVAGLVGCAKDNDVPSHSNAILSDREAARLAELHLDDVAPSSNPRDIVSIVPASEGTGYLVGFDSFFDETQRPPKTSRLVVVDHDGDVREMSFKD
jgi:hypothetical protein